MSAFTTLLNIVLEDLVYVKQQKQCNIRRLEIKKAVYKANLKNLQKC